MAQTHPVADSTSAPSTIFLGQVAQLAEALGSEPDSVAVRIRPCPPLGLVAQRQEASDLESEQCGSDSLLVHHLERR